MYLWSYLRLMGEKWEGVTSFFWSWGSRAGLALGSKFLVQNQLTFAITKLIHLVFDATIILRCYPPKNFCSFKISLFLPPFLTASNTSQFQVSISPSFPGFPSATPSPYINLNQPLIKPFTHALFPVLSLFQAHS